MTNDKTWEGFVYGEERDGSRSLGFKLLAPRAVAWSAEVEGLARKLQACPYPETWRPAELFCSLLLEDGRRLVGVARYGLRDHSPGQRPGGLELLGAVGPANISLERARALAHYLATRRTELDDPVGLAGAIDAQSLPATPATAPCPSLLPLQPSKEGVWLITGVFPEQPDQCLSILDQAGPAWQWLPYCGPDFPFDAYAHRGSLIAWTPPRSDLAVFLQRTEPVALPQAVKSNAWAWLFAGLLVLLVALNAAGWWFLPHRLPATKEGDSPAPVVDKTPSAPAPTQAREKYGEALYRLLASRTGGELLKDDKALRHHYQRLLQTDPELRCDQAQGQIVVGAVDHLAGYNPDRVARLIMEEFADKKGFDGEVVRLISDRVRQRLAAERPGK